MHGHIMTDGMMKRMSRLRPWVRVLAGRRTPGHGPGPVAESDGHGRFESRLVWIFGSPRSGSTWLLNMLVHPLAPAGRSAESELVTRQGGLGGSVEPEAIPVNEPYIPQHLTPPLFQDQAVS